MILAIDTSTEWMGLGLFDGGDVISEHIWHTKRHHTIELVPALERMIKEAGLKISELKGIGVALGPGSFTSLRIGVTVAKGLAMALSLSVVGVHSLDILAAAQPQSDDPLWAVLHAGRKFLAFSPYTWQDGTWVRQAEAIVITPKDLEAQISTPVTICGEMTAHDRQILGRKWKTVTLAHPSLCLRRPSILAKMAWDCIGSDETPPESVTLSPIYLHTSTPIPE